MPLRRSRIVRVVDHPILTAMPENSKQDTDELLELISPASYSFNVTRRGLTSPSLDSLSTFSGVGESMGRLARLLGESILSLVDNTATSLRLRTIRRQLANQHRVPLAPQQLSQILNELESILEIKDPNSVFYQPCLDLIRKILTNQNIFHAENGYNLIDFHVKAYEHMEDIDDTDVGKSFVKMMLQFCESGMHRGKEHRERIISFTSFLCKLAATTKQFCNMDMLKDILFILSSQAFVPLAKDEVFRQHLNTFIENLLDVVGDWMSEFCKDHRNCYIYASLASIHSEYSSLHRVNGNSSFCALGLEEAIYCGSTNFRYPIFETPNSFLVFEVFHDLRNALYEARHFSEDSLRSLLTSPDSKFLLSNGLKNELLAFLPILKQIEWRFGVTPMPLASSAAVDLLFEIFKMSWIDENINVMDDFSKATAMLLACSFEPLTYRSIKELIQIGLDPPNASTHSLAIDSIKEAQLRALQSFHVDLFVMQTARKSQLNYYDNHSNHAQLAKSCLQLMNKNLTWNILQLQDVFSQYDDMDSTDLANRVESHIGEALQYACQYWLRHVLEMNVDDFGIAQEAIRSFFFGGRHFLHWIEVMSATKQVKQAEICLLSFYNWTKGNEKIEQNLSKLVYECYYLLRCFNEPIASGPLQVYSVRPVSDSAGYTVQVRGPPACRKLYSKLVGFF